MSNDPELNCGLSVFPKTRKFFSVFANIKWFLAIASFSAIMQGTAHSYYNRTMHVWKEEYGFSEYLAEWVIVVNELSQGLLALFVINSSNKRRRIVWVAGTLAIFAVASFALLIPELVHPIETNHNTVLDLFEARQICHTNNTHVNTNNLESACWTSFAIMFLFQLALGTSLVCLYVHTILYLDDHETTNRSIILIGIFMACKQLGSYVGLHLSWLAMITQGSNIFGTAVWISIVVVLFICAGLLGLYPNYLNESVKLKTIVASSDIIFRPDLGTNIQSIFKNKLIVLNILFSIFMISAIGNFNLIENKFIQSKFLQADEVIFHGTLTSQIVTSLVKPVSVCIIIILSGFLISKFQIQGYSIGIYNGVIAIILTGIFLGYIFLGCDKPNLLGNKKIVQNWCSYKCNCEDTLFEPVCFGDNKNTYFSPCYAGCKNYSYENGMKVFTECTCGSGANTFSSSCSTNSCDTQWIVMVSLRTVSSVLASSVVVGHTVLNLYLPHFTERSYVLAVQSSLVGILAYGPMRAVYLELTNSACRYPGGDNITCNLHESINLSIYTISITVVLLIFAAICTFLLAFFIYNEDIYKIQDYMDIVTTNKKSDVNVRTEMQTLQQRPTEILETTAMLSNPQSLQIDNENENRTTNQTNQRLSVVEADVHIIQPNQNNDNQIHEIDDKNNIQTKSLHETSM